MKSKLNILGPAVPLSRQQNYKDASIEDILRRADELVGSSIHELLSDERQDYFPWVSLEEVRGLDKFIKGKGPVGVAVEELVFGMKADNKQEADFTAAGVELKTTGLKEQKIKTARGAAGELVAKERLTLGLINYKKVVNENWLDSTVVKKCSALLLLFYIYEKGVHCFDLRWKSRSYIENFFDLPEQFITQIRADWSVIVQKIRDGEAHLLSSGDTSYLEASRKGSSTEPPVEQPYSRTKAKKRAFSLKAEFVDHLFRSSDEDYEYKSFLRPDQTIEDFADEKLSIILGKTGEEIAQLQGDYFNPKNKTRWRQIIAKQLAGGRKMNELLELKMSFTELKVLNFEYDFRLKESISFPYFDYFEVANTPWEESDFFEILSTKRFLFAYFRKRKNGSSKNLVADFIGWQFWSFPIHLLGEAKAVYEETQRRILNKNYNFPRITDSNYCHVRPHGKNASDLVDAPDGTKQKKYCFWLNARFIADELIGEPNIESN